MEEEKEFVIPDGSLYYTVSESGVLVTRFQGTAARVTVPAAIEGRPVRGLFKKAFLSRKDLRRVTLPDTLEEVGDWAFGYCSGLVQVTLPQNPVRKIGFSGVRQPAADPLDIRSALGRIRRDLWRERA